MAAFTEPMLDRGLPAAIEAERTILGAILLNNDVFFEASGTLLPGDFSLDSHRRIWARIVEQMEQDQSTDPVALAAHLEKHKELNAVGGQAYLWSLSEGVPHRISIEQYVRIVRDKSVLRQLMGTAQDAMARAADQSEDPLDLLNALQMQLMELTPRGTTGEFYDISSIVQNSFGSIDKLIEQGRHEVTGLATRFTDLDIMTAGLQPKELIILAARPSMGKTAMAVNIAQNAAVYGGKTVAIFSLEMSKESLLRRLLASEAMVSMQDIQKGFISREAHEKLAIALDKLVSANIFIDDTPGISLAEMRAKARRLKQQKGGLDLVMIDYLQLMTASAPGISARRYENRTQEVSAISRGLKILAKELDVPVLALSQLSRASETRTGDKKPMLSDLRESGSIEQDADVVAFIHRQEYYERENPDLKGKAEIIIAKQRNGPTGTVTLHYHDKFTRFDNVDLRVHPYGE